MTGTTHTEISKMVDALLEKMTEDEIRAIADQHASDGYFGAKQIIAELDRRKRSRLPFWRRIFQ